MPITKFKNEKEKEKYLEELKKERNTSNNSNKRIYHPTNVDLEKKSSSSKNLKQSIKETEKNNSLPKASETNSLPTVNSNINNSTLELPTATSNLLKVKNLETSTLPTASFLENSRKIVNPFKNQELINTLNNENNALQTARQDLLPVGETSISSQTYKDMKSNDLSVSVPAKIRYLIDSGKSTILNSGKSVVQYLQGTIANDNQKVLDSKFMSKFRSEGGQKALEETNKNIIEQTRKTQADKNADTSGMSELTSGMQTATSLVRNLGNNAVIMAGNYLFPRCRNSINVYELCRR